MLAKSIFEARAEGRSDPFRKVEFIRLSEIAIREVALHFEQYPDLKGIEDIDIRNKIIDLTSKTLPIQYTAQYISNESYWKESCFTRWPHLNAIRIENHGNSWKSAYLEKFIEELLMNLEEPDDPKTKECLIRDLKVAHNWVHTLIIPQMKSSFDLNIVCLHLPLLCDLTLTFGVKHSGMKYKRQNFGMKLSEAANLGDALKYCNNLLSLNLSGNMIDDDFLRFIMTGLNINISLIELNLSHNKIGDQGARRLAKYLIHNDILLILDLSDNLIGYEGSRYLAQAMKKNQNLQTLKLKLNNFNDKAGMKFFKDLMPNKVLQELDFAANTLSIETASKIQEFLSDSFCILKTLDLSNNDFGDDSYEILRSGLTKNLSLTKFYIRDCKFKSPGFEKELTEIILKHHLSSNKIPFFDAEEYAEYQAKEKLKETTSKPFSKSYSSKKTISKD